MCTDLKLSHLPLSAQLVAAYDLQLAEVALRQSVGEKAEHVMGLDKCLARYCTRTNAMTEDLMASHYVSKRYHVTNLTQVSMGRGVAKAALPYPQTLDQGGLWVEARVNGCPGAEQEFWIHTTLQSVTSPHTA